MACKENHAPQDVSSCLMPDGTTFNEEADETPTKTPLRALADGVKCFTLSDLGEEELVMSHLRPAARCQKRTSNFFHIPQFLFRSDSPVRS